MFRVWGRERDRRGMNNLLTKPKQQYLFYHRLSPATPCPFCGLPLLAYKRPGHHGDIYQCDPARGGCRHTVVHRRHKGSASCGLALIITYCVFGTWVPCDMSDCDTEGG